MTTETLSNVLYERKGPIAYVTLNRPKVLNALSEGAWEDLRTAFEQARNDAAVLGVILTGAGDKAFIAGEDISELAHATPEAVNKGMETSLSAGLLLEASVFAICAGTEDKHEGTSAFLEKRAPQFHGR
jgi:enoyl-CoA hydratase/carnithine racemase